jgi:hypothetical protein
MKKVIILCIYLFFIENFIAISQTSEVTYIPDKCSVNLIAGGKNSPIGKIGINISADLKYFDILTSAGTEKCNKYELGIGKNLITKNRLCFRTFITISRKSQNMHMIINEYGDKINFQISKSYFLNYYVDLEYYVTDLLVKKEFQKKINHRFSILLRPGFRFLITGRSINPNIFGSFSDHIQYLDNYYFDSGFFLSTGIKYQWQNN